MDRAGARASSDGKSTKVINFPHYITTHLWDPGHRNATLLASYSPSVDTTTLPNISFARVTSIEPHTFILQVMIVISAWFGCKSRYSTNANGRRCLYENGKKSFFSRD